MTAFETFLAAAVLALVGVLAAGKTEPSIWTLHVQPDAVGKAPLATTESLTKSACLRAIGELAEKTPMAGSFCLSTRSGEVVTGERSGAAG
ncbi:hypothetical protein [Defluviimonas salinarum]|uniref:Uncharacterized protein n=1 Tax=Defluviimonas salinarum TaxID=2992147 RepID=A0ABT3J9M9_9RHOB|nr:hypothetical protein [Defluviimonas salinarum]MCW3784392.1 hypothetical protein [Defluviimonas salinarum]